MQNRFSFKKLSLKKRIVLGLLCIFVVVFIYSCVSTDPYAYQIEYGNGVYYVLKPSGDLISWGNNEYHQNFKGYLFRWLPFIFRTKVLTDVVCVDSNFFVTVAVDKDGNCWGQHLESAVLHDLEGGETKGDWTLILKDAVSVSAGYSHVIAIKSDGTLWGLGRNPDGIGTSSTEDDFYPLQQIMEHVCFAYAWEDYSFVITEDHVLYVFEDRFASPVWRCDDICEVAWATGTKMQLLTTDGRVLLYDTYEKQLDLNVWAENVRTVSDHCYITDDNVIWVWNDVTKSLGARRGRGGVIASDCNRLSIDFNGTCITWGSKLRFIWPLGLV